MKDVLLFGWVIEFRFGCCVLIVFFLVLLLVVVCFVMFWLVKIF